MDDRVLLNAWKPVGGAEAHITLQIDSDGIRRHLTLAEARGLAAELLAAVGEADGTNERLGWKELYAVDTQLDEHTRELEALLAAQLRAIAVPDGKVVQWGGRKSFFCKRCDAWIQIEHRLRNGQARRKHAESIHLEAA